MFGKLSVNFICFAWLVHCFDIVALFLATFYWCSSSSLCCVFFVAILVCFLGVRRAFVVAHCFSLLISIPFCVLLLFVMLCWWSSLPLCYVLLVVINAPHCTCWCSLLPRVMFCWCSLTPLATFCWCSSWPPYCVLLVFVVTPLLHYVCVR